MLEYVNLQVDIEILKSRWELSGEFSDQLVGALAWANPKGDSDVWPGASETMLGERQASTWWLWFGVTGAPL
ncbi:hypothetical protein LLE87_38945, partial [Paenibacillus polymyxa]|nr:hypothetical protein [Paenibacillus polymyxa]